MKRKWQNVQKDRQEKGPTRKKIGRKKDRMNKNFDNKKDRILKKTGVKIPI